MDMKQKGATILLVDDEEALLSLVKALLVEKGYTVLTARDGLEGLQMYQANQKEIALVLSDVGMPVLNGYDLYLKLREVNPAVRVIIGSGFYDNNMKSELERLGVRHFIQKPYTPEVLLGLIREVLESK